MILLIFASLALRMVILLDDYINGNLIEEFSMNVNPIIKQGRSAEPKWSAYSFNKFNKKNFK